MVSAKKEQHMGKPFDYVSKHKLNNLIILIDYNKIQALDYLEDALPLKNLKKKSNHLI